MGAPSQLSVAWLGDNANHAAGGNVNADPVPPALPPSGRLSNPRLRDARIGELPPDLLLPTSLLSPSLFSAKGGRLPGRRLSTLHTRLEHMCSLCFIWSLSKRDRCRSCGGCMETKLTITSQWLPRGATASLLACYKSCETSGVAAPPLAATSEGPQRAPMEGLQTADSEKKDTNRLPEVGRVPSTHEVHLLNGGGGQVVVHQQHSKDQCQGRELTVNALNYLALLWWSCPGVSFLPNDLLKSCGEIQSGFVTSPC